MRGSPARRACRALSHFVMAAIIAAALGKLADLRGFAFSLHSWMLLPEWMRGSAVYLVPTLELFIGLSWFFGPGRRWVLWWALALIAIFSLTYAFHLATVGPPKCQCFGLWFEFRTFQSTAKETIYATCSFVCL